MPPSQLVPPHDCCGDMLRKFRSLTRQKASNLTRFNNELMLACCDALVSYRLLARRPLGACCGEPSDWQVRRERGGKKSRKTRELQRLLEVDLALSCAWLTLRLQFCNKTQLDIITRQSTPSCKANCTAVAQIAVKRPQVLLDIIKKTSSNQLRCCALPQRWR